MRRGIWANKASPTVVEPDARDELFTIALGSDREPDRVEMCPAVAIDRKLGALARRQIRHGVADPMGGRLIKAGKRLTHGRIVVVIDDVGWRRYLNAACFMGAFLLATRQIYATARNG